MKTMVQQLLHVEERNHTFLNGNDTYEALQQEDLHNKKKKN